MNTGEPKTPKEKISIQHGYLWKMLAISEVNTVLSRKYWILINIIKVYSEGTKPVPVVWLFKSKEESDRLIHLKSRNIVKGYIHVPRVEYT